MEFLDGKLTEAELHDRGIYATRQLAKRQLTWLRTTSETVTVDCLAQDAAQQVHDIVARELAA